MIDVGRLTNEAPLTVNISGSARFIMVSTGNYNSKFAMILYHIGTDPNMHKAVIISPDASLTIAETGNTKIKFSTTSSTAFFIELLVLHGAENISIS